MIKVGLEWEQVQLRLVWTANRRLSIRCNHLSNRFAQRRSSLGWLINVLPMNCFDAIKKQSFCKLQDTSRWTTMFCTDVISEPCAFPRAQCIFNCKPVVLSSRFRKLRTTVSCPRRLTWRHYSFPQTPFFLCREGSGKLSVSSRPCSSLAKAFASVYSVSGFQPHTCSMYGGAKK